MNYMLKYKLTVPLLCLLAVAAVTACDDWTEPESLSIERPDISGDNPELYARYLENLNAYKASDHKVVYAWFDNSVKVPVTRAHRMDAIPDSVDIVSLLHPDGLCERELAEMKTLREKGTKVIFTFDYDRIEALWKASQAPDPEPEPEPTSTEGDGEPAADGFLAFLAEHTDAALKLVDKYGYDGAAVHYTPLDTHYMEEAERVKQTARQALFTTRLKTWAAAHADKLFVYEGDPQWLIDKSLLGLSRYIVLRKMTATTPYMLSQSVLMALREGVPADRFIVAVAPVSTDPNDPTTGRFAGADGQLTLRALTEAAAWVTAPEAGFTKAGLGIYNIQDDFYNTTLIYKYTREAIDIMNPSPQK